jgi:ABC-2 type transport system permease protein
MSLARVAALMGKESADLRAAKGVLLAPLAMLATAVATPLLVAIALPVWSGERLDATNDVVELARTAALPGGAALDDAALVQAFLLHKFLPLLALVPVIGAMTLVTTSIVGEKQARTLEPLLATPLTSAELLLAKTASAFAVSVLLAALGFVALAGFIAAWGLPGVAGTLFTPRALTFVWAMAPAAALVALTMGAIVSTRARDARSAQQAGVLVVLPFVAVFVAGLSGELTLTTSALWLVTAALLVLAAAFGAIAVRLFDRERMLTDWT